VLQSKDRAAVLLSCGAAVKDKTTRKEVEYVLDS
jgi:hypothetical protein